MTTDFYQTWLPSSQSPCSAPEINVPCWERCVKRKYNDGSGRRLEGYTMAETSGSDGSLSCEALWDTMPRISDRHKTSCNLRRCSFASLQDEKLGKDCYSSFNASNLGGSPHNPHPKMENEISCSCYFTDYPSWLSFAQSQCIQSASENAVSKKRIHVAMSHESMLESEHSCETTTQNEVIRLKDALKLKKRALRKLYKDLEAERHASTTAANEAMAMIRRLQEEKAAALVESRHYRLASEEREIYNHEAIVLLKEALLIKEYELVSLQDHIETYRKLLLTMKSGQRSIQSTHLEGDKEREQLLLLEGKETTCLLMDSNQIILQSLIESADRETGTLKMTGGQCEKFASQDVLLSSECSKLLVHKDVQRNVAGYFDKLKGVHDTNSQEDRAVRERVLGNSMYQHHYPLNDIAPEEHNYQENEIGNMRPAYLQCDDHRSDTEFGNVFQEQDLEDVSMSIFVHVGRLEEGFACFGQNHTHESESFDLVPHKMAAEDISELKIMRSGEQDSAPVTVRNAELNHSNSEKLREGFVACNCKGLEDLKCSVIERFTPNLDYRDQEHCASALLEEMGLEINGMKLRRYPIDQIKAVVGQEHSFSKTGDAAGEGLHDVYEVKRKINGSVSHLDHVNGTSECGTRNRDALLINASQALQDDTIKGVPSISCRHTPLFDDLEGCDTLVNDKLAHEISSVDGEYVKSFVAAEDVQHLNVRLQALEGERAFMKEAIESLREENKELKLLQEIAERLRELRGDVWKTEGVKEPGCHDHLPFLSFFKGILSFSGIQSIASTKKRRFFYASPESSETSFAKEHGGLFHLLNNSLQEEKSVCLTRERKVKLVNI